MKKNPVARLAEFGQSIWLDYIRRDMICSGELAKLIDEDGLRGVTSNPAIFEKAISGSDDYDDAIRVLTLEGRSASEIYDAITIRDVQDACDLFRPLFERSDGQHGFVSLEVSPHLAHDTDGTIAEATRLWRGVDRPNVMIKVPGTREGLPAIQRLFRDGVNVNVTLLFGLARYRDVAQAYLSGLAGRFADGNPIRHVASVASFFLSRIDVLVDPMLDECVQRGGEQAKVAEQLRGQVAIASAKLAYQIYKDVFDSRSFGELAEHGARTQRVLWASTSTKNPAYSDIKYVEALIGPETVNTLPPATLDAYRDHGHPTKSLEDGLERAEEVFLFLPEIGIDIDAVTQQLEDEGLEKFSKPFDNLLDALDLKRSCVLNKSANEQHAELGDWDEVIESRLKQWDDDNFCRRLWDKDATLWASGREDRACIANSLGWLQAPEQLHRDLASINDFVADVRRAGFRHVVHMGMGGSSLAPLVFQRSFWPDENDITLTVLDTTDPATVLAVRRHAVLDNTLFIVASKSGTTAETRAFEAYFFNEMTKLKGRNAGDHFAAITDANSPLEELAAARRYRKTFLNPSDVGGRYSALTYFGLVPAALLGVDLEDFLLRSERMVRACGADVIPGGNPGIRLGAIMGEMARRGVNKVTLLVSERIAAMGLWLEQLLAESTGKDGTGIIPINAQPLGAFGDYGDDRLFVVIRLDSTVEEHMDEHVAQLRDAGAPS